MSRIGILGGTFNPPHLGHLVCASEALEQLGLERVVLMPAAVPPHKEAEADPGGVVRAELCRRAVAGDPRLAVSSLELERGGPSYTVETLRALHSRAPNDALTFIVGADMAQSLPSWREPEAVLELARLAVAERRGVRRQDIASVLAPLGDANRVAFFEMPRIDVSSSDIRRRVAAGRSIRYLVPDGVAALVRERNLYREGMPTPDSPTPEAESA